MKELHEALLRVRELVTSGEVVGGICTILQFRPVWGDTSIPARQEAYDYMSVLFKQWPKFSGDPGFPVVCEEWKYPTHPYYGTLAEWQYYHCAATSYWEGLYGQKRRELLDFLIEVTSESR